MLTKLIILPDFNKYGCYSVYCASAFGLVRDFSHEGRLFSLRQYNDGAASSRSPR